MRFPALVHAFPDELWRLSPLRRRSHDCTPWYVDRYRGPRQGQPLTAHSWWELTCVVAGAGELTARTVVPLAAQSVCLIPPRVRHDERASEVLETIWIGFHARRLPRLTAPAVVSHAGLTRQIEALWLLAQRRGEPIGPELDALTAAIVAQFLRLWQAGATDRDGDALERAVRHLEEHLAESLFVGDLARRVGLSEGHFYRRFKQHTGLSPMAYLNQLRLQHAAHLLTQTDWPIAEIARQVGYPDQFYFSRLFRNRRGQSPTQYRAAEIGSRQADRE